MCRHFCNEMLPLSRHIWSQKYSKLVSIEACMVEWMEKLLQPVFVELCDNPEGIVWRAASKRLRSRSILAQILQVRWLRAINDTSHHILISKLAWRYLMTENRHIFWNWLPLLWAALAPAPVPPILLVILRLLNRIPYLEHGAAKHE